MIDENENGLKGQHNLAQGKRSGALGLEDGHENRPRENVHKGENLNSDEKDDPVFPRNYILQFASRISSTQFRPKRIICFIHRILTDGFSSATSLPRAAFRFVPSETLPWARLCWPFRPEEMLSSTCV